MAEFKAEGGEVTTPYGSTVLVLSGRVQRRRLAVRNITGPGDNGNTVISGGNFEHAATLRGVYREGATRMGEGEDGSASVQLGNGATWSGDIVIEQEQIDPSWNGGGSIPVMIAFRWTGPVSKTGG